MTSMRWLCLFPIILESVRVTDADVAVSRKKIEGKIIKCTAGGNVVFEKAEHESVLPASFEYAVGEGAGDPDWVIDIPNVLKLEVDSKNVMIAQMGLPIKPLSYTVFPSESLDPSEAEMQKCLRLDTGNWIETFAITRVSEETIRITAEKRKTTKFERNKYIEIEFTGAGSVPAIVEPRQHLPALEYYMPMQGKIIRLKVDGKIVFDQGSSDLEFPVVGTPALSGTSRGLNVNLVGFTHFWVSKNEMDKKKHFSPNSHGFTVLADQDALVTEMMGGFSRWKHQTRGEIDFSPELKMSSNDNSVEISGNGTELIFSKEIVAGKVTKCSVDNAVVFDQAEQNSVFTASWKHTVDKGPGNLLSGWAITIPGIVKFNIDKNSLMASKTSATESSFVPSHYTIFPMLTIDESGAAMKSAFTDDGVNKVVITWDSHTTIKLRAHMTDGKIVDIEFTRGPTAANAGDYGVA